MKMDEATKWLWKSTDSQTVHFHHANHPVSLFTVTKVRRNHKFIHPNISEPWRNIMFILKWKLMKLWKVELLSWNLQKSWGRNVTYNESDFCLCDAILLKVRVLYFYMGSSERKVKWKRLSQRLQCSTLVFSWRAGYSWHERKCWNRDERK